ncbi:Nhp2 H/ACA snoRNP protein [Jimgerdemannia flammicorona]|uniref:H/ACA ribonucleoprotein complex subunit 2 n=2 Tax=Jimgerdemannia flammicorona TaxID=994334 RepID=A0A433A0P0_9FUNG|nr:Nhp2 H/ACA snoRNP protein [Jimgerdemannia flammicorona]RUS25478.1 Nhp2 H/ACA snoRNP protein [Jimgerdemannia flammicorona]
MAKERKEKKVKKEKKEKKVKKVVAEEPAAEEQDSEEENTFNDAISPIARPLAAKALTKKLLKTVKKAKHVKRGVKEVVKGLRKGEKGLVVIAGDISPMDVITHVPVLCEDANVPYIFVPSKEDLGTAGSAKRPTSCVMVVLGGKKGDQEAAEGYKDLYEECYKEAKDLGDQYMI